MDVVHCFRNQTLEEVCKLLGIRTDQVNSINREQILIHDKECRCDGLELTRDTTNTPINENLSVIQEWRKFADVCTPDDVDLVTLKKVQDKVKVDLALSFPLLKFDWDKELINECLIVNDARTKISSTSLTKIFEAMKEILDEDEALTNTAKITIQKISSIY